jgi:hypothetical protein
MTANFAFLRYFMIFVCLLMMCAVILYMRRWHAPKVYVSWLVFSFFFSIFIGPAFYADRHGIGLEEVCGDYEKRCAEIIAGLTSFEHEIGLLAILIGITVVPQLLAYCLSALSGSATAPRYIWTIHQMAVWSLIKFVAGIGGIFLAQGIARSITDGGVTNNVVYAAFATSEAFVLAFFHLAFWDAWEALSMKYLSGKSATRFPISAINSVHAWATRNVPAELPHTLTRAALIKLLESDAVYDFITHSEKNT